jgi:serine/threonine protein kinase
MPLRGEFLQRPTYQILRSLHGGGVGELKLVSHHILGRQCVQKTYSILGLEDSVAYDEPRLLNTIRHDHIVPVYEAQYDPDWSNAVTFVMPYYEGGSVEKALIDGYRFSIKQAVQLASDMLDALAHVHTRYGYLHRDPKPGNLFLSADRDIGALGDFGAAARMDPTGTTAPVWTSLLYLPPESGQMGSRIDVRADIYGATMTLHEMLSGRLPYEQLDRSTIERRLTRGLRGLPDRAYSYAPHVPSQLRRIVSKGLARDRGQRFGSASGMIRALERSHYIDWCHVEGEDSLGGWEGSWPLRLPPERRRYYRVEATAVRGNRVRLSAFQRVEVGDAWRRFGVEDERPAAGDDTALVRFFQEVASRVAQILPAR